MAEEPKVVSLQLEEEESYPNTRGRKLASLAPMWRKKREIFIEFPRKC